MLLLSSIRPVIEVTMEVVQESMLVMISIGGVKEVSAMMDPWVHLSCHASPTRGSLASEIKPR